MAVLAQRLPVAPIPEQNRIAAMRNDMVNNGCRRKFSVLSAFDAERIFSQEQRPGRAPPAVVSALGRVSSDPVSAEFGMFLAVHATVAEVGTARIPAGSFRFSGHGITSQNQ